MNTGLSSGMRILEKAQADYSVHYYWAWSTSIGEACYL